MGILLGSTLLSTTQCALKKVGRDPDATGASSNDGSGASAGFGGGGPSGGGNSGGASGGGPGSGGSPSGGGPGSGGSPSGGGPMTGDACDDEGAFDCAGTASRSRLVCQDGEWTAGQACPTDELCDSESTDGDCKPVLEECMGREPGAPYCVGPDRRVCGADLVTVMSTTCDTDDHCTYSTTDTCAVCLPNEADCQGQTLLVCNETRTGFDETECTSEPCNATARACSTDECTESQLDCQGDVLVICNETLSGFDELEDCTELGPEGHCDLQNLECDACQPGNATCNNDGRDVCDQDGQGTMFEACDPGSCSGPAGSAVCSCPVAPSECTDEGTFCNGDSVDTCGLDADDCLIVTDSNLCQGSLICTGSFPDAACTCPTVTQCDAAGEMNGSYCSGGGNLATCTADAQSCQELEPTTCAVLANEGCFGSHPNARCELAMGNTSDTGENQSLDPNLLYAVPVTVSETVTLRRLGLVAGAAASGVRLMLYADSGGPAGLLAGSLTGHSVALGRNEYNVDYPASPPILTPGTYWLAILVQSSTSLDLSGTVGVRYRSAGTTWPVTPPDPFGTAVSATLSRMSLYLIGRP